MIPRRSKFEWALALAQWLLAITRRLRAELGRAKLTPRSVFVVLSKRQLDRAAMVFAKPERVKLWQFFKRSTICRSTSDAATFRAVFAHLD